MDLLMGKWVVQHTSLEIYSLKEADKEWELASNYAYIIVGSQINNMNPVTIVSKLGQRLYVSGTRSVIISLFSVL